MSNVLDITVFGFVLVFGSWLAGGFFFKRLIADVSFPRVWLIVLEIFPALSLYRGLDDLFNFSEAHLRWGHMECGGKA
ncbi:unnamed protein product [Coffea canephora]|uniref:Uncharacterized protein n=1 Tax=Coffea canephora TaxID=49390 RepID=A0A068V219_COFCA|nr:unnamed protein product [Coffea canephora]